MPKETKETKKTKTTTVKKKTATSKKAAERTVTATKASSKKVAEKKATATKTSSKKVAEKKATATKTSSKKVAEKKATAIKTSGKKNTVAKKKSTSKKTNVKTKTKKVLDFSPEYYDLPYRYNQTIVKILAQTPSHIFVYWDISDEDRENFKKQYGEYFFEITKPVLIIHNESMNYSFEVDINDFANSWYLNVNDSNCEYNIELGRRPIPINYNYMPNYDLEKNGPIKPIDIPYIYISSSNELEVPNDHILFYNQEKIYFKNVKNNEIIEKNIKDFKFAIGKNNIFKNIYEIYKYLYKEEILNNTFDLNNPSSGNLSSGNIPIRFK